MLSSIIFMQFKTARETNITDIQNMNEDELKKEITSLQNKFEQADKLENALDICMFKEQKLKITGRKDGATTKEFGDYVMKTTETL